MVVFSLHGLTIVKGLQNTLILQKLKVYQDLDS